MEFKLTKSFFAILLFFAAVLSGCVSAQKDVSVSAEETEDSGLVIQLEQRLIKLDAKFILNKKLSPEQITQAEELCTQIDGNLDTPLIDKVTEARLLSLKGRLLFICERKMEAEQLYSKAKKKYAADTQLIILGRRLGLEKNICETRNISENAALQLEAAVEKYENGEYDIATGFFDGAFLASDGFYQAAYSALRQRAWDLRNIDGASDADFWLSPKITLAQMLEAAQRHPALLGYYTGGRKMDSKKLFRTMQKAGLFESVSKTSADEKKSEKPLTEKDDATRVLAARFLWNIYTDRNNFYKRRYSDSYRSREKSKSPVSDIDIYCEDFDAVLGVVSKNIMDLVDGKNFNPDGMITAPELEKSLKKVEE